MIMAKLPMAPRYSYTLLTSPARVAKARARRRRRRSCCDSASGHLRTRDDVSSGTTTRAAKRRVTHELRYARHQRRLAASHSGRQAGRVRELQTSRAEFLAVAAAFPCRASVTETGFNGGLFPRCDGASTPSSSSAVPPTAATVVAGGCCAR
jgi:hypothetical protein